MKNDSALGPDGFTVEFYKLNWSLVGREFTEAIDFFFTQNFLYFPLNTTVISLIPKVACSVKMKEFMPISCCNVSYKVISKIIANRIKPLLPLLVNPNQSAFVKGRSIQDNILLMHSLVRHYQRNGGPPCCAIKVDIMKAFDTLNWSYLMSILKFPEQFKHWTYVYTLHPSQSTSMVLSMEISRHQEALDKGIRCPQCCSFLQWKVSHNSSIRLYKIIHFLTTPNVNQSVSILLLLWMIFSSFQRLIFYPFTR